MSLEIVCIKALFLKAVILDNQQLWLVPYWAARVGLLGLGRLVGKV